LLLGRRCIGLRGRQAGLVLLLVRHVLLGLLNRSASLACQLLIALGLLARESQRCLRLRHLLIGLVDLCLLRCDLSGQIVDARLRLVDLRLGLVALGDVIAVVEAHQSGAGIDELVVGDRDIDDRRGNLCADLHGAAIDECIVGRFITAGMQPPADEQGSDNDPANDKQLYETATLTETLSPRLRIPRLVK
jgi:hypothetical protein